MTQLISIGAKHRAEYKERKKYINKKARPKLIVIGTIFSFFLVGITISLMRQGSVTHQACNAYRKVLTISGKMTDDEWRNQLNGVYLIALDSHDPSMVKAGHQLLSEITTFDPYVLDNAGYELAKAREDLKNDDSHLWLTRSERKSQYRLLLAEKLFTFSALANESLHIMATRMQNSADEFADIVACLRNVSMIAKRDDREFIECLILLTEFRGFLVFDASKELVAFMIGTIESLRNHRGTKPSVI